ncbi:MAG: hypothetical protein ACK47B_22465 [Armatimonadota bacterium]
MANASAIAVTDLVANGAAARPVGDVLDTGTGTVTLSAPVAGESDRVVLEVTNTQGAAALQVAVKAGANPPAFRAGLGDYVPSALAAGATALYGPFESARFVGAGGALQVAFTPASGTIGATIRCYRLPKA